MRFATKRFYSNPGSPLHKLYSPKVSKDGSVELVESGVENIQDYIESFRESTDIKVILDRVAAGETELLMSRPGSYGDFTKMPQTYAEALQLQIDSANLFSRLPAEVRNKFGNDQSKFFAMSGTKEWYEHLSPVLPDEVRSAIFPVEPGPIEKEVKE